MPYSSSAGKGWIASRLAAAGDVRRVLDIGVGAGIYANLFRSRTPGAEWVGIEVWAPYVEQFQLQTKYDRVVLCDVQYLDFSKLGFFDVCFCGDVLEHMPTPEARRVIDQTLYYSRLLFISVPLGHSPQEPINGNPFERHLVEDYSDEVMRQHFPEIVDGTIETDDTWMIGAYVLTRDATTAVALNQLRGNRRRPGPEQP